MRTFDSWSAFIIVLFGVVGLCGLFASYAPAIPVQRAQARNALIDDIARTPGKLDQMRPALGTLAPVLDGSDALPDRISAARRLIAEEERREAASIGFRVRLMLGVVTSLAAGLGAGILALARRTGPSDRMYTK